jgi:hypothetical protein
MLAQHRLGLLIAIVIEGEARQGEVRQGKGDAN